MNALTMFSVVAETTSGYLNQAISGVDFTRVLSEITATAPALLPVAVACIAFRKGISFMFSILRGA